MSDELIKHGHAGEDPEYEHEDLGTRGIFAFMVSLIVSGIVIVVIIVGMYRFLDKQERAQMTTASPLVPLKGEMTRSMTQDDVDTLFKDNGAPMLETSELSQFRQFLVNQENQLNSYGWVDEKAGVAHIPIERAMELMVQRGIPVCAQNCGNAKATAENKAPEQKRDQKSELAKK
jgi:hypothetical protein